MTRTGKWDGRNARFQCLLFDLDGTLVNSREDLITSVNLALGVINREPLSGDLVASFVGEGVSKLIERSLTASFGQSPTMAEVEFGLELFFKYYRQHLLDQTRAYPGVADTLSYFHALPMGIVTNKPSEFTHAILEGLNLIRHFRVVLGGDSLPERKPDPAPLLEAARVCGTPPESCLMVGDSRVDVLAGQAAGMKTCGYNGGFRGRRELEEAGADFLIEHFDELRQIVDDGN